MELKQVVITITIQDLQDIYMMEVIIQEHMIFQIKDIMINTVMEQVVQNIQEENEEMLQKKWLQQEYVEIGIQITLTSLTLLTLGSRVGATTALVPMQVCSASPGTMVVLTSTTLPALWSLALWTDEKRNSLNRSTEKEKVRYNGNTYFLTH